jgi:tetratricopeptide (TPR) repeat protein
MTDEQRAVGNTSQEGPVKRQNRTGGVSGCVEPEMLAAYVDGTLDTAAHGEVEAHLADCDLCREVVAEAAMAREALGAVEAERPAAGRFLRFASRGRRIWPTVGVLAAAAAVTLAVVVPRLMRPADPSARPELAELVAAVGEHRPFEPRLTGGFKYGPLAPVYRSGEGGGAEVRSEVVIAGVKLEQAATQEETLTNLVASATGLLVRDRLGEAVQILEEATRREPRQAAYWSDLSAAYLVRGQRSGSSDDAARALSAADRALSLAPSLREALFNRALALTALGRGADATAAWNTYVSVDADSPWAAAARDYLRAVPAR